MKKILLILAVTLLVGCQDNKDNSRQTDHQIDEVAVTLPENNNSKDKTVSDDVVIELEEHLEEKLLYKPELYNFDIGLVKIIENPKTLFVMGNKLNQLPSTFVPENLVVPDVKFSFSGNDQKKQMVDIAARALEALFKDAKKDGLGIVAVSGYRSYERQKSVYQHWVDQYGQEEADKFSARPGHSEHQTGLTMDVSCSSLNYGLEEEFGELEEGLWLKENAHLQGFIIRYPENKTEITGYNYEPWHLRFVGVELANHLFKNDLTLEEYYVSLLD